MYCTQTRKEHNLLKGLLHEIETAWPKVMLLEEEPLMVFNISNAASNCQMC
jgi:hypothetical protein